MARYRVKLERTTVATATIEVEVDVEGCEDELERLDRVAEHAVRLAQAQVDGEVPDLEQIDWSEVASDEVSIEQGDPELVEGTDD